MYHKHFGFSIKPFQINTDPRFLWLGEKHKEALSVLRYGVEENLSFLLLTGDVGTGKTTLVNALLESMDSNVLVARIPDPRLDLIDFMNILSSRLGMNETFKSRGPFLVSFEEFLKKQHHSGKNVLLIIDEAQRLTHDLLEEIRALSNLEKPHTKLLNVFFVGQEEFNDILLDKRSRAIRQRIRLSYHIDPLTKKEVGEYIWHRQKVAGSRKNLFSKKAVDLVHEFSGGFPRLINIICDHALLTAYAENKTMVSDKIVRECSRDVQIRSFAKPEEKAANTVVLPGSEKQREPVASAAEPRRKKMTLAAFVILLFLIIGAYLAYLWLPASAGWLNIFSMNNINGGRENHASVTANSPQAQGKDSRQNPGGSVSDSVGENKKEAQEEEEEEPEPGEQAGEKTDTEIERQGRAEQLLLEQEQRNNTEDNKTVSARQESKSVSDRDAARRQPPEKLMIYFPYDAYGLNSNSLETLDKAKQLLRNNPDLKAEVMGYTDSLGDLEYNLHLSKLRANIVRSYLTGNGVDPEQIESKGLGPQNQVSGNQTPQERARNRRVEIMFEYTSR